jgi:hypothetical protein
MKGIISIINSVIDLGLIIMKSFHFFNELLLNHQLVIKIGVLSLIKEISESCFSGLISIDNTYTSVKNQIDSS